MTAKKIAYYAATGLLSVMMLMSAGTMLLMNHIAAEGFVKLGYPTYITYYLGVAKVLGLVAIWSNYSATLKEWAYAGFFFNFLLAFSAHINAGDGEWGGAAVALALLLISYFTQAKEASR